MAQNLHRSEGGFRSALHLHLPQSRRFLFSSVSVPLEPRRPGGLEAAFGRASHAEGARTTSFDALARVSYLRRLSRMLTYHNTIHKDLRSSFVVWLKSGEHSNETLRSAAAAMRAPFPNPEDAYLPRICFARAAYALVLWTHCLLATTRRRRAQFEDPAEPRVQLGRQQQDRRERVQGRRRVCFEVLGVPSWT